MTNDKGKQKETKVPVCCWEWGTCLQCQPWWAGAAVWRVTNGASESEAGLSSSDCPKETKSGLFDVWDTKGRNYGAMYCGGTWVKYRHLVGRGGRISTSKPTWSLHKYYTHKHAFTCYIHVTRWYGLSVSKCANPTCNTAVDCDHVRWDNFERELTISSANAKLWLPFFEWFEEPTGFVNPGTPRAHEDWHALVCLQIPTIYIAHQQVTQILAKWSSDLHTYALACIHFPHLHIHYSHTIKKLFWILPNQPPFSKRGN